MRNGMQQCAPFTESPGWQPKKHDKWINSKTEGHGIDESQDQALPPAQWEDLDHSFCHFIAGSFGKRQGLEFKSDMGPFVHSFAV